MKQYVAPVLIMIAMCAFAIFVVGSVILAMRELDARKPLPPIPPAASIYEIEWCMGVANPDQPTIRRFHTDSVAWGTYWIWFIDKDTGKQVQLSSTGVVIYCSPNAFEGVLEKD